MKTWLTKFRISAALDQGQPLSPSLRQAISQSAELRQFEEHTRALEQALTETKPALEPPPSLHRSIMRSVRAAESATAQPSSHLWRWLAAPGLAVALALGVWVALKPPAPAPAPAPLVALSTTLEVGNTMPQTLPPALLAPLSEELDHLNRDLDNTAQFLLASVP